MGSDCNFAYKIFHTCECFSKCPLQNGSHTFALKVLTGRSILRPLIHQYSLGLWNRNGDMSALVPVQ